MAVEVHTRRSDTGGTEQMCPWYGGEGVKALLVAVIREIGALRCANPTHSLPPRRLASASTSILIFKSGHAILAVNKKG